MKFIIYLAIIMLCAISISAITTPDSYYSFDLNEDDDVGSVDGTNNGASQSSSCVLNNCYDFESSETDYIDYGDNYDFGTDQFSISAWIKLESTGSNYQIVSKGDISGNQMFTRIENSHPNFALFDGSWDDLDSSTIFTTGKWYHLVFVRNATQIVIYINGTHDSNLTSTPRSHSVAESLIIGAIEDGAGHNQYFDGLIDEVGIWDNYALTGAEVSTLYNGGSGYNPTSNVTSNISQYTEVNSTFNVSITSKLTGATNCSLSENSTNVTCSIGAVSGTNTTSICTLSSNIIHDQTLFTPYCNNATRNESGTGRVILVKNSAKLIFNSRYIINGTNISNFNLSYTLGNFQASGLTLTLYNFYGLTEEFTYSEPSSLIDPFNITANKDLNITLNASVMNSLNISFRDEENESLLSGINISIELISDSFAQNYTNNTGNFYVDLLMPENYTIRYSSNGFYERFYYLEITNRTVNDLTLYLLSNSTGSQITLGVFDNTNENVQEAYVRLLRYYISDNSYKVVEMALTNDEGDATLHAVLDDEFYQFLVYQPFSTLVGSSVPSYLRSTTPFIQVDLIDPMGENFDSRNDVIYTMDFNNATNNFRLTFSNLDAEDTTVSLNVYKVSALGKELANSSTTTSSAATLLVYTPQINGTTYIAEGVIDFDGETQILDTFDVSFADTNHFGSYGLGLTWFMILAAALIGIWNIGIAVIFVALINLASVLLGLIPINLLPVSVAITFVAVVIVIIMGRDT